MEINKFVEFLGKLEKLKCNTRHSWTSSDRQESVAEHSWRISVMALFLKDEFPSIDIDKVIKMCLLHDIGEAVTGDIPAFDKTEEDRDVENDAVLGLLSMLPNNMKEEYGDMFFEMEECSTDEAKLFKALDKIEALIQHNEADIDTWIPLEYELNLVYGEEACDEFEYTKKLRGLIRKMSEDKMSRG